MVVLCNIRMTDLYFFFHVEEPSVHVPAVGKDLSTDGYMLSSGFL